MIHRLQFGLLKCEDFRRDVSSRGRGLLSWLATEAALLDFFVDSMCHR